MKRTRTTISTIEMREVFIIRNQWRSGWRWCEACAANAPVAAPEVAAKLSSETTRSIYRLVEEGRIHFTETPDGDLLICLNSLNARKTQTLESFQKALPTLTDNKSVKTLKYKE